MVNIKPLVEHLDTVKPAVQHPSSKKLRITSPAAAKALAIYTIALVDLEIALRGR